MGLLAPRPKQVQCFFCHTQSAPPASNGWSNGASSSASVRQANARHRRHSNNNPTSSWLCAACGCWNARDASGTMVSDSAAMHNASLNESSFARRGQRSDAHLPSAPPSVPFCRDCLTNQTLLMNLLGNYLPDESDPAYPTLERELPQYVANLHARYPPVCARCQPEVDDALRRADQRAQTEAWGSALKRGRTQTQTASVQGVRAGRRRGPAPPGPMEAAAWKVRRILFAVDLVFWIGVGLAARFKPPLLASACSVRVAGVRVTTFLLCVRALSILWAAWDPTWLRRARNGHLGVRGRAVWVTATLSLFVYRAVVAALLSSWSADPLSSPPRPVAYCGLVDIIVLIFALTRLRLDEPVALTLVRPVTTSQRTDLSDSLHAAPPAGSLSALSLSNTPPTPSPNPIFGQQSFTPAVVEPEEIPMDWEPTPAPRSPGNPPISDDDGRGDWDVFGVGKQRMFPAKTEDTGLESLLAGWGIGTTPKAGPVPLPAVSFPAAPLAPRPGLVLDDKLLRTVRKWLMFGRVVALASLGAARFASLPALLVAIRLALWTLLRLEAFTAGLALVLSVKAAQPLPALVYACDAAVRATALTAHAFGGLPTLPDALLYHTALLKAYPAEAACTAWTLLDAFVLVST